MRKAITENCLQWNDKNEKGFLIIGLDVYIASYLSNTIGLRKDQLTESPSTDL